MSPRPRRWRRHPHDELRAKIEARVEAEVEAYLREHEQHVLAHGHAPPHGPVWKRRRFAAWYLHARMRRRVFSWFGVTIAVGAGAGWAAHALGGARWWPLVAMLAVLWMASGVIAWRLTGPLLAVVSAARSIGAGDLSTRIPTRRHKGELAVLASAINDMAERIQKQLDDQRQLLAAVSHELRTPLGHVRVLIDTARDAPGGVPPRLLDELEREVLDLDRLVDRLLASSRLDFATIQRRSADVGVLAVAALEETAVAPDRLAVDGDCAAAIDPTLVRRAIVNLLENARVHGGGAVAVRVERRDDLVVVEVDDAGPGVAEAERERLFAPFERGASAGGGLGLGLALVARIARAHGGKAWLDDRPGGGARVGFAVTVVAAPPNPPAA